MARWTQALLVLGLSLGGCKTRESPPPGAAGDSTAHPAPAPAAFAILAPSAGTTWVEGQSYVIRWQGASWPRINIGVAMGGKDKGHLVENYSAALDSLGWTIPPGFVSGFGLSRSDNMRLRFENADDPGQFVDSDSFAIRQP